MSTIDDGARIVTRQELIDAMRPAFHGGRGASRERLLSVARDRGARRDAIEVLELLPRGSYSEPRQIWTSLRRLRAG